MGALGAALALAAAACSGAEARARDTAATRLASPEAEAMAAAEPEPAPAAASLPPIPVTFTAAQVTKGESLYTNVCLRCHPVAQHTGGAFAAKWEGRRVYDLYDLVAGTMPQDNPGSLTSQQYADVVAYLLKANGAAPTAAPLPPNDSTLRRMRIHATREKTAS